MSKSNTTGIAVGFNGAQADAAVRYGALQACTLGVSLTILHVLPEDAPTAAMLPLPPEDLRRVGTSLLSDAARVASKVAPEVEVFSRLLKGHVVPELVEASRDCPSLVLGHESTDVWARVFTGRVTLGAASLADCPVVSVPEGWSCPKATNGPVVVGFETPDHDSSLLEHAFDRATSRGAPLTILHAWELPSCYDTITFRRTHDADWNLAALERIETQIADLRIDHPRVQVEVHVVHKQPALALREASQTAELLMLARRSAGPPTLRLGGTARALLRSAACPVEIVPSTESAARPKRCRPDTREPSRPERPPGWPLIPPGARQRAARGSARPSPRRARTKGDK